MAESPVVLDGTRGNPLPAGAFSPGRPLVFNAGATDNPYVSYSGADIVATMSVPGEPKPVTLGELQTLSYSMHRENTPVRLLGHAGPVNFVRGTRTIAGSMIFTTFNAYAFYRLSCFRDQVYDGRFPLADQLPPFDITLSFFNEYGSFSTMKILGISIIDEGGTMSIDDLITEQVFTYMARGIQPMMSYTPGFATEPTGVTTQKALKKLATSGTTIRLSV